MVWICPALCQKRKVKFHCPALNGAGQCLKTSMEKLTKEDKIHLADKAVNVFGMICVVIAIVALYMLGYWQGVKAERKATDPRIKAKDIQIDTLQKEIQYKDSLIFR